MEKLIFTFDEEKHIYTINGKEAVSVTNILQEIGVTKDYKAIPQAQQKFVELARERGNYYDKQVTEAYLYPYELTEWQKKFLNFLEKNNLEIITVQEKVGTLKPFVIAGTLDLILRHTITEKIYIVDFKATAMIYKYDVMNQVNCYSHLIPNIFPEYKHEELGKAVLHYHEDSDNFTWMELDHIEGEIIEKMFQAYQLGEKYTDANTIIKGLNMVQFSNLFDEIQKHKEKVKKAEKEIDAFHTELKKRMSENNIKTIETKNFRITYTPPGTRETINYPEILVELKVNVPKKTLKKHTQISTVKDKLTITKKKNEKS